MTLWKNESSDIVQINFDIGKGFRELISLNPGAEIELPAILDTYVPREAPQLQVVKSKEVIPEPKIPAKKKPGRKPKDPNGIH